MPVPTLITDLDPVAGNNSPASSESPKDGDDYIRALSAFVAQLYDGSNNIQGVVGTFRDISGSSSGSIKTASWTASELVAKTSLGGNSYIGASLSLSFNGATTGANGMDTGSTPTSSDLYIYAIYNPTTNTWATLGTISGSGASVYGGSNMPSGYTASCLLWSGKTNASGQFEAFMQQDRDIEILAATAISAVTAGTLTSASIASIVPVNARSCGGYFTVPTGVGDLASTVTGLGKIETQAASLGAMAPFRGLKMATPQTIYFATPTAGGGMYLYLSSYTI